MKTEDVMSRSVVTVREDTPFKEVVAALVDHAISAVPVVDGDGRVVGIVTEADLIAKEAYPGGRKHGLRALGDVLAGRQTRWKTKAEAMTAGDVMTGSVIGASPHEDLHTVARRMLETELKRLVVIDAGRPVGIISRVDLLRVFLQDDVELAERIARYLVRCGFAEPDYKIRVRADQGVVTLEGSVLYEGDIHVAGALVREADGIVGVENYLLYRSADPKPRDVRAASA